MADRHLHNVDDKSFDTAQPVCQREQIVFLGDERVKFGLQTRHGDSNSEIK